ncbi:MAG: multidrug ABC transporter ATP-binding protein [Cellulomonas sp. 73-92]|uniref:ABC transporter ATP-binding protein n=1 Tax=Cellulomonas sp. 73-92 TaxID=1895740 RepID=UPI000927AC22|nr:ATP-binding cassette domain-containing protein [Cellulomonas sp. 73-92]OJV75944.1 MAG: multidrug ABC transporter ATP-binding protein [Cellulomonas sp. 73-92]
MIQVEGLSKVFGRTVAVDDVTFTVQPGRVTGFLGPNGAGKSTTMRMVVGLDRPTAGRVLVDGAVYAGCRAPLRVVGALLEAKAFHPGRTARQHLLGVARTHGIGRRRVEQVLELTGLAPVADKRVGGFSLGMGQRLGIATALLGDPGTLVLDEPVNGLDPEGVIWVRHLVRHLAGEGRTVFLSSHLMSEMGQTADHLLVIGRGRILADAPIDEVVAAAGGQVVRARTRRPAELSAVLQRRGLQVVTGEADELEVTGASAEQVAEAAAAAGIVLRELTTVGASLEQAYLALTSGDVEYQFDPELDGSVR